jgi:hypothetical protein
LSDATYDLIVGTPVTNCDPASSLPVTSTSGGSITLADTWSEDLSVGLNLGGLQLGSTTGWSQSQSLEWGQEVAIEVNPGEQVCFTLVVFGTFRATNDGVLGCFSCPSAIQENIRDCEAFVLVSSNSFLDLYRVNHVGKLNGSDR